ncbi:MAG: hypothetical protein Q9160_002625 [Pyrenula sp. 1 TL-2023]
MSASQNLPPGSVEVSTLSVPQLSSLQSRLSQELEHLTSSHTKLRAAQSRFRECIKSVQSGVKEGSDDKQILVPLTGSLYVPGKLASKDTVIVDVGTGFYVEKTTEDATKFYNGKVSELGKNLEELEKVVTGKSESLRVIEDALRQKVIEGNAATTSAAASA